MYGSNAYGWAYYGQEYSVVINYAIKSYSDAILATSDLELYWRLGETSGTNADDSTANNRDGTYSGGYTQGAASPLTDNTTAVDLDGSNGRVASTYNPFTNGTTRTFEGWAWRDASTTRDTLFGSTASSSAVMLSVEASSTNVKFWFDTSGASSTWTGAWPGDAQWVHWALIANETGDKVELYINGVSKGVVANTLAYQASPGNFVAGARGTGTDPFDGKLDEIAIYSRALSPDEIKMHYVSQTADIITVSDSLSSKTVTLGRGDTITLSDVRVETVTEAKADTITLTDARGLTLTKPLADTITLTDADVEAQLVSTGDTITLTDTLTAKTVTAGKSDTVTLSDVLSRTWTAYLTAADTITLTDARAATPTIPRGDTITLSDAKVLTVSPVRSDTVTLSDAKVFTVTLAKADTITLSDARVAAGTLPLSDTITLTDAATLVLVFVRTAADTLTLSDHRTYTLTMESVTVERMPILMQQRDRSEVVFADPARLRVNQGALPFTEIVMGE